MPENRTMTTVPNCSIQTGNVSCFGPPPPKDYLSLLSLKETLDPIFMIVEFSALSVAFLGNLLIVLTILSNKKIRSMAHLFLVNVAIADLFFSALNIAGHATEKTLDEETLKRTFCTLYRPIIAVRFVAYAISMFCLAALSVERWYVVCSPLNAQFSSAALVKKLKFSFLVVMWMTALAISTPLGLCKVTVTKTFAIVLALILHLTPLAIIITMNTKMLVTLKRNAVCEISAVSEETREKLRRLLIILTLSVLIFWSPYHCLFLYFVFAEPPFSPSVAVKLDLAFRAGNVWAYFNPLLNALLYYIFSKEFRKGAIGLLSVCCGCKPVTRNGTRGPGRTGRTAQELVRFSTRNEAFSSSNVLAQCSVAAHW